MALRSRGLHSSGRALPLSALGHSSSLSQCGLEPKWLRQGPSDKYLSLLVEITIKPTRILMRLLVPKRGDFRPVWGSSAWMALHNSIRQRFIGMYSCKKKSLSGGRVGRSRVRCPVPKQRCGCGVLGARRWRRRASRTTCSPEARASRPACNWRGGRSTERLQGPEKAVLFYNVSFSTPSRSGPECPGKVHDPALHKLFSSPRVGGLRPQKHHQKFSCLFFSPSPKGGGPACVLRAQAPGLRWRSRKGPPLRTQCSRWTHPDAKRERERERERESACVCACLCARAHTFAEHAPMRAQTSAPKR